MHFLICDDDPVIRYLLDVVLSKRGGHEVTAVSDPADVVSIAAANHPDAVIIDYTMPGMSGIDVARELAGDPHLSHVPVVLLTGRADLGGDDFTGTQILGVIEKPFNTSTLIPELDEMIGSANASRQSAARM